MAVGDVKGLDAVIQKLNKEIKTIKGDVQKGLTLWGMTVKAQSMKNTPVDTGNLKGSHYVVSGDGRDDAGGMGFSKSDPSGKRVAQEHAGHVSEAAQNVRSKKTPVLEIGCTAFYAVYVHEDMEASHIKKLYRKGEKKKNFVGPVLMGAIGKAKFLEDAIKQNSAKLIPTITRFAKR